MQMLRWLETWHKGYVGLGESGNKFHVIVDPRCP